MTARRYVIALLTLLGSALATPASAGHPHPMKPPAPGAARFEGACIEAATSGSWYSLFLDGAGRLWHCGSLQCDPFGQAGGWMFSSSVPVRTGMEGVTAIGAGAGFGIAARTDGTAWVWGSAEGDPQRRGMLPGMGPQPVQVPGLGNVIDVAMYSGHAAAVEADGSAWGWGDFGNLQPEGFRASLPTRIEGLPPVLRVEVGWIHGLALTAEGDVWAWGDNSCGALGNGAPAGRSQAGRVDLHDVVDIAAADLASLALRQDGTVWAWGRGEYGFIGDGRLEGDAFHPVEVELGRPAVAIAATADAALAVLDDGSVWGWGTWADIGYGVPLASAVPVELPSLAPAREVFGGYIRALVLTEHGALGVGYDWGVMGAGEGGGAEFGLGIPVHLGGTCVPGSVTGAGIAAAVDETRPAPRAGVRRLR